jgi:hypothetical protein
MRILITILFFCGVTHNTLSQLGKTYHGISIGSNFSTYPDFEVGYGLITEKKYYSGKKSAIYDKYVIFSVDLSTEFLFAPRVLIAPKTSTRFSFELWDWNTTSSLGIISGIDFIHYSDFQKSSNILKPVIGLHLFYDLIELTYGYNIILDNSIDGINNHVIQLRLKPFIFIKSQSEKWSD